jgi:hypothetical protein
MADYHLERKHRNKQKQVNTSYIYHFMKPIVFIIISMWVVVSIFIATNEWTEAHVCLSNTSTSLHVVWNHHMMIIILHLLTANPLWITYATHAIFYSKTIEMAF